MLAALGVFVFQMGTAPYQQLQRSTQQRLASSQRIGQRPVYQHAGPGEDAITLSGTLMPEVTGGPASLDILRTMADMGQSWPLVSGKGYFFGLWIIETVEETRSEFFPDGTARKIDFSLSLKRTDEGLVEQLGTVARFLSHVIR